VCIYTSLVSCEGDDEMMNAGVSLGTRSIPASLAHSFMSRTNSRTYN